MKKPCKDCNEKNAYFNGRCIPCMHKYNTKRAYRRNGACPGCGEALDRDTFVMGYPSASDPMSPDEKEFLFCPAECGWEGEEVA